MQAEGLIDLIGFQGHAFNTQTSSAAAIKMAAHALSGIVHVESSQNLRDWQRTATYDLNLRNGENFERAEGPDGPILYYAVPTQTDSPSIYYRYVYELSP
ncbi:hypothetical protein [Pelagicoccus sp. SDUM812002]|uniref:hypothetical protein n=1 Tax=Pelagicoccus sp. SDUM812002 TaxID=3041266 RepID=UPI00280E52B9|nr:hypothetical protein [Pelagicoccus sp. SDUM812002]MDQ8188350.1 hypothetical protein [Pelagicoccus sp. SDUM812002]